jgi:hypothetical protein
VTISAADSAELGILEQLRQTPALLDAVAACSEAERGSQKRLRIEFDGTLVRAAVALHEARQRASGRLPEAGRLWLTRIGVEQATAWPVARHKAERFAGCSRVADLCCGIGSDTAALSQLYEVLSVDRSPAMVRRAEWNTAVLGQLRHFCGEVADVTRRDWTGWFVHADPDRRVGRNRPARRLADYQPGLPWLQQLLATARGGGIKLGPASDWPQQVGAADGCEVELMSLGGECREATLWFGALAGTTPRRATNVGTGESLAGDPAMAGRRVADRLGGWIAEPDPAVIRAGLVDLLAEEQGLARTAADEDYLTGPLPPSTSLAASFAIEEVLPASIKLLRQALRRQPRRFYEIKCRRLKVDVEAVRRQLPVGDGPPAVIIFCRIAGQGRAILTQRS